MPDKTSRTGRPPEGFSHAGGHHDGFGRLGRWARRQGAQACATPTHRRSGTGLVATHEPPSRTGLAADLSRIAAILERHSTGPDAKADTAAAAAEKERPEAAEPSPVDLLVRT